MAIFMHHSPLNSVNDISQNGIEFNLRLILGPEREKYGFTFWDDIIFSRLNEKGAELVTHVFTSCIHYFQQFSLKRSDGQSPMQDLLWTISGGAPETRVDDRKLLRSAELYNRALQKDHPQCKIEVANNRIRFAYNFLLINVKDGRIDELKPVFVPPQNVKLKPASVFNIRASWRTAFYIQPPCMGQIFRISLFSVELEGLNEFLQFITLDPSVSMGFLYYNSSGDSSFTEEYSGIFEFSPLVFQLRFPSKKNLTLFLLEILFITGQENHASQYLSFGAEIPIFQNLFGKFPRLKVGFRFLKRIWLEKENDPDFGSKLRFMISFGYHF